MIIGLVGFAGSGKGSVADMLVAEYGFTKVAFADPLKDAVAAIFSWPRHLLEGDTDESRSFRETEDKWWSEKFGWTVTPRIILQKFGTEACREGIHQDIWYVALEKRIQGMHNVVVPDVRFPNEMKFIQKKNGFNIRVKRGPEPEWFNEAYLHKASKKTIVMDKYPEVHYSEWAWIGEPIDYILNNDSSLDALRANTTHMFYIFKGPAS